MNTVLRTHERTLVSFSRQEIAAISNSLNEVCNGIHIDDFEFETRLGETRDFLLQILQELKQAKLLAGKYELAEAWSEDGSVKSICITSHGEPVDMSVEDAQTYLSQLQSAIKAAC